MASRTMLFDLSRRAWSEELLRLTALPAALFPPALPSGQIVGWITPEAARACGLPAGLPVATGGHDHICAALAAGVIDPGTVLNSSGTTDTILSSLEQPILTGPVTRSGLCCGCHTAPDRFYLVGGFMSGAVVNWVIRMLAGEGPAGSGTDALQSLMAAAAQSPPLANGVWFLPYLGGSGPPDRDADAWGAWLGLRLRHNRDDLARAAMEGLSFALRYLLDGHQRITGNSAGDLRAVGGGTRNTWWQQVKADVLGLPVEVPDVSEVTARGAALLAGMAVGIYANASEAAGRAYRPTGRYEPDRTQQAVYDRAYRQVFRTLYPALRGLPV
jgi:xylulokinase